jgi:hypothetical protein
MAYLPSLVEMPCPQSCYFTIPQTGRSHGSGDQADHGYRGNQTGLPILQRQEMASETIPIAAVRLSRGEL